MYTVMTKEKYSGLTTLIISKLLFNLPHIPVLMLQRNLLWPSTNTLPVEIIYHCIQLYWQGFARLFVEVGVLSHQALTLDS